MSLEASNPSSVKERLAVGLDPLRSILLKLNEVAEPATSYLKIRSAPL